MKSKTKKILAGACLGIVGMGCLTGCSMSDEQKAALDLITDKSDEIVNLLEENLNFQNTQLSKQEAYEMIVLSSNAFEFGFINKVQINHTYKNYYGYFEDLKDSEINVIDYSNTNNIKYLNQKFVDGNDVRYNYYLADHENNIYLLWNGEDYEETFEENSPEVTIGSSIGNFVNSLIDISTFTSDNVYGVDILEDGTYNFSVLVDDEPYTSGSTTYDYKKLYKITIKDNLLIKVEMYVSCTQNRDGGDIDFVTSHHDIVEFNYNADMDFSVNETKPAELLANNA